MRTIGAAILAATMLVSNSYAATNGLSPGKPAGVKTAQSENYPLLLALGAGVVIGGIVLVATGNDNNNLTTSTATATGTTSTTTTTGTSP